MKIDFDSVLDRIKPSEKEEKEMKSFTDKLLATASDFSEVKPMICGSIAKGTWLSEKNEADMFLLFDPSVPKKLLEKRGLEIAKKIIKTLKGKFVIAYAEHPYLKGKIGKHDVDIVPCYDIIDPGKIKSSVDRTPHHVKFVNANLKNPDDVRLLKQLCKVNRCYGADLKTEGFSGYICELMIIKYGSFLGLVKEASNWRAGHALSFCGEDTKKFKGPFVFIDPVDMNRNVGAAISAEGFYRFVGACKMFMKNPSNDSFFVKKTFPYSAKDVTKKFNKRGTQWYMIRFKKPDVIDDILYPQLRRGLKAIDKMLEQNGFKILRSDFYCEDECVMVFEMETWHVPKVAKNIGPNIYGKHSDQFLSHYKDKNVFIEGENWVVEIEREFTTVNQFIDDLLAKKEKELLEKGIPSKIAPLIRKADFCSGEACLKMVKKLPEGFRIFLKEWFEKNLNVI
ncbi:MAG: CCA tRNA nucleotidyltransferase [Candidatus Aenigmatarchaeota archaeon]